jgi:hypothetical protein
LLRALIPLEVANVRKNFSKKLEGAHHIQPVCQCHPPPHNISWAKTLDEGPPLGLLNGPPLRMEHLTKGCIHLTTGDLCIQVLLDDLMPPLYHMNLIPHEHQDYQTPRPYRYIQHTSGWLPVIIITIVTISRRAYAISSDSISNLCQNVSVKT